ncbi:hypothetical protein BH09DEP1_BH09DEP1_4850 [soil metagenome]
MKQFLLAITFLAGNATIITVTQEKKARCLGESKQLIESEAGKRAFEDQLEGKPQHKIGKGLSSAISLDELSGLVFKKPYQQMSKDTKTECLGLMMQRWPGRPELYIGVGHLRDTTLGYFENPAQIFITLFKISKPHTFEIVSQTAKPFLFTIQNPAHIDGFDLEYALDELLGIDGAPFKIAPNEYAFGLRLACNKGYAGGFAQFQNLILFCLKDKTITPILNIPIYSLENYAGDWNEDGTRERFVTEREWVVCITEKKHNEHFNLQIKQKKTNKSYQLTWNSGKYTLAK